MARARTSDSIKCNLYSVTTNKEALRELARAMGEWLDETGNFQPLPAVFPNWVAPVVRSMPEGATQATLMRWGFPFNLDAHFLHIFFQTEQRSNLSYLQSLGFI
jgi:putative SOS response-associated peptidase YedK